MTCPMCRGDGTFRGRTCEGCNGTGRMTKGPLARQERIIEALSWCLLGAVSLIAVIAFIIATRS